MPTIATDLDELQRQTHRGLTLTELLVVVAILGALATGVVPSVRVLLAHANADDVSARIQNSWQLALATAQAGQRAVVWHASSDDVALHLAIMDAQGATLWSSRLAALHARILCGADSAPAQAVNLVVYPHGLTDAVSVEWDAEGHTHHVALQEPEPTRPAATTDEQPDAASE